MRGGSACSDVGVRRLRAALFEPDTSVSCVEPFAGRFRTLIPEISELKDLKIVCECARLGSAMRAMPAGHMIPRMLAIFVAVLIALFHPLPVDAIVGGSECPPSCC